ncbi:TrbC/VirB2 family protein [Legionella pneumophila serogroup 1]|uniref:TrbC/VirB2 family protein n=1 Tax=Legionella pneumophila TaxID=446 RepID=UPI0007708D9B|nr:TrbC/VirB2 family protein [Legionella pneumophila]QIB23009.1 TrbC/VirB2 family protein [Legionella pneumophila]CZG79521.1 Type IV secretory pathway%2C VirB2 components (pilins) [Legionella pneumophila]
MSKFKRWIQFLRNHLSDLYVTGVCALLPSLSHAQSIESIINRTINYLQGGLARTIGVFCIIIAGYLCLARQKFPKEYFVMILVGMGIIFGGSSLYSTLIG